MVLVILTYNENIHFNFWCLKKKNIIMKNEILLLSSCEKETTVL